MSGYIQTNQTVKLPDRAYTVSVADSGKLMLIGALTTATRVITLPDAQAGLHYRFMVTATLTQIARITPAAGTINGALINNNAGAAEVVAKAGASADLTATAILGDFMDVYCDGTNWHCSGMSAVGDGLA